MMILWDVINLYGRPAVRIVYPNGFEEYTGPFESTALAEAWAETHVANVTPVWEKMLEES